MPDTELAVPEKRLAAQEAVKERALASSNVDHEAVYSHVAVTKPQLFGRPEFTECPQCGKQYRLFNNPFWKGDQSVCQACADENTAPIRDVMQKIERSVAEKEAKALGYEEPAKELQ